MKKLLIKSFLLVFVFLSIAATSLASRVPTYDNESDWCLLGGDKTKSAVMFLVGPTASFRPRIPPNADIDDEFFRDRFRMAIAMQRALYEEKCDIYAPFYRHAAGSAYFMPKNDAQALFNIAYSDVREAFLYFLENYDDERPLVLAGFSQGAQHLIALLKEFGTLPQVKNRLVAAYAIGWRLTERDLSEAPHLKPAQGEKDLGAIIVFTAEAPSVTDSVIIPKGVRTFSINPLNWRTDGLPAAKEHNLGACLLNGDGSIKEEIPHFTGAYIDFNRGALKLTGVDAEKYKPGAIFSEGVYHLYDYQFFFRNLQKNVGARIEEFLGRQSESTAGKE